MVQHIQDFRLRIDGNQSLHNVEQELTHDQQGDTSPQDKCIQCQQDGEDWKTSLTQCPKMLLTLPSR